MAESAQVTISAFGDEIADDLSEQLSVLKDLNIHWLDLRGAWGKNVLRFSDGDVAQVKQTLDDHGVAVSCIGSPIGKSPIAEPVETEAANLARLFQIGEAFGVRQVRVFSFYPPDTSTNAHYDDYLEESIARLAKLTQMAEAEGFVLMLENEKGIVGDTLSRCAAIVSAIDSLHLRFLWDPANFIQVGEGQPTAHGWASLGPYIGYVHIKDAVLADGGVRPAGKGDGQVAELLTRLRAAGYDGFLALEPHLAIAGHSSGYSGPEGMAVAVEALRNVMRQAGLAENQP
jgi:sugar phosphate isomerase/epimerase